MKLVQGCFWAMKDGERNCHGCGGAVNFVQACLNVRNE